MDSCALHTSGLAYVPAGIYHRFTLDEENRIKTIKLFRHGTFFSLVLREVGDVELKIGRV